MFLIGNGIVTGYNAIQGIKEASKGYSIKTYALIEKIRGVFLAIDFASCIWGGIAIGAAIDKAVDLTRYSDAALQFGFLTGIIGWIALTVIGVKIVSHFAHKALPAFLGEEGIQLAEGTKAKYALSKQEEDQIGLYTAQIILQTALTALKAQPVIFSVVNIASLSYCLYKCATRKWLCISKSAHDVNNQISRIDANFFFPIISKQKEDICAVCREENPTLPFCVSHVFHEKCTAKNVSHNMEKLFQHENRRRVLNIRDGVENVYYDVTIKNDKLPSCPECRQPFAVSHVDMTIGETKGFFINRVHGSTKGHTHQAVLKFVN